jgi:urease accessory protein UreF
MDLAHLLASQREEIVAEAADALSRAPLHHYAASGAEENRQRVARLYALLVESVRTRDLAPMLDHARAVARERHREGFDLREVHAAFNVLEEAVWQAITSGLAPADYPEAFGLASTVLGAGKEALAVEYVTLASQTGPVRSLDLSALFKGT